MKSVEDKDCFEITSGVIVISSTTCLSGLLQQCSLPLSDKTQDDTQ